MDLRDVNEAEPIRIGICGTSGVGKTTLAMQLVEWLKPVYKIEHKKEAARIVLDKHKLSTDKLIDSKQSVKNNIQLEIFFHQLKSEMSEYSSIVSDRTLIDVLAYSKIYGVNDYTLLYMENVMQSTIIGYDIILYAPIPDNYITVNDGVRSDRNIAEIDSYIKYYYDLVEYDELCKYDLGRERKYWFEKSKELIKLWLSTNEYN